MEEVTKVQVKIVKFREKTLEVSNYVVVDKKTLKVEEIVLVFGEIS